MVVLKIHGCPTCYLIWFECTRNYCCVLLGNSCRPDNVNTIVLHMMCTLVHQPCDTIYAGDLCYQLELYSLAPVCRNNICGTVKSG